MLDDGAIGRGDPSVRHHFRDSVSDTMRITDLAAPRKIPPGTGWRKFVYSVSFHKINPGESPRERHYRNLQGRIRRHIRRQYVITVVSGKGGVGVTTMAACIGGVFRECRPENVIAIDAVPSFGTLADRIDESPPGDYAAIINDTDVQGYADIREHLGQNTVGLDVLAGNRTSDQPRPLVPAMFSAVLSRLRRTHTVIVIDTSPDLEHDVMKAVLQSTDTLVFVSGITADRSRPVLRAVDYLRAQGYHELVSRSTVILNHTDSITDKDALAYLTERFTKVGAIVEAMPFDPHLAKGGSTLDSVARAVVHAANMGAKVINISVTACLPAAAPGDQRVLGAALWYAATVKDAVIVAAAGNDGEAGCGNNPMYDPLDPSDPRDWHQVTVVSSPSWFSDYVLSVGAVDAYGAALDKSMSGPWVGVAAPGTHIMGLSPQGGGPVNAYPPSRPGEKNMPFWGTSFSAAYVSGVAALVRAKFPELTAYQVINRIVQSAHNPPAGVDNKLGYGLVDPVAALTFNIPSGDRMAPGAQSRVITPAAPPPPPDHRARNIAIGFVGAVATGVLAMAIGARLRRAR